MNKLIIPSILTATVLVAGLFAFIPIEKASTVHTTISIRNQPVYYWQIEDPDATIDIPLIPAVAGRSLAGTIVLSNLAGLGTCSIQDDDDVAIDGALTAVAGGQSGSFTFAVATPAGFTAGDGIELDIGAGGATCSVSILVTAQG